MYKALTRTASYAYVLHKIFINAQCVKVQPHYILFIAMSFLSIFHVLHTLLYLCTPPLLFLCLFITPSLFPSSRYSYSFLLLLLFCIFHFYYLFKIPIGNGNEMQLHVIQLLLYYLYHNNNHFHFNSFVFSSHVVRKIK